jgi:hypothetical protein
MWKMFVKAGEPGWKVFIPIYNVYVEYKIAKKPNLFWMTLGAGIVSFIAGIIMVASGASAMLGSGTSGAGAGFVIGALLAIAASIVVLVAQIQVSIALAHAFGQSTIFGVGILLIPVVFIAIIALGDSTYVDAAATTTTTTQNFTSTPPQE